MRERLIRLLRRVLAWLEGQVPPVLADDVRLSLAVLMAAQDAIEGRSGEAKRHQVLAKLLKQHPAMSESDAALAIELLVQERKGRVWVRA